MRSYSAFVLVAIVGCSKADPPPTTPPTTPVTTPELKPVKPAARVTIEMTAATLADDCGGAPPSKPAVPVTAEPKSEQKKDAAYAKAKRKCEQTSMQLSITAAAGGAPIELRVKKVELFDEGGSSLGELASRSPIVWSDAGAYQPWDQMVAPGKTLSVSYSLAQPSWGSVADRWNKTYVLKAVISVGGDDQTVKRDVQVSAETSLPPNVKT